MNAALPSLNRMRSLIWERWPAKLARVSQVLGYTAADGRYLSPFPFVMALLPVIMFLFGLYGGITHFHVEQPLYTSVLPFLICLAVVSFLSGGAGLMATFGYIIGRLFFFQHEFRWERGETWGQWLANLPFEGTALTLLFFTLISLACLPTITAALTTVAVQKVTGGGGRWPVFVELALQITTELIVAGLLMLVWVQLALTTSFAYYNWQDIPYGRWDVIPFLQSSFLYVHAMVWTALAAVLLRYVIEALMARFVLEDVEEEDETLDLPEPIGFGAKIPMGVKSLGAALLMTLIFAGYLEQTGSVLFLLAFMLLFYQLRDGWEVFAHKWYRLVEIIPLAYRLPLAFILAWPVASYAFLTLEDEWGWLTIQAIVGGACAVMPVMALLISKFELHRQTPPPPPPFWTGGLARLFKKLGLSITARRKAMKAAPHVLGLFILLSSSGALAHHCFEGCSSCFFKDFQSTMAILGLGMMAAAAMMLTAGQAARLLPLLKNGRLTSLSSSDRSAIRGLRNSIKEHKQKLKNYKQDPFKYDNKDFLKNAPAERQKKIIESRIKNLEKQIETFKKDINKIRTGEKKIPQKQRK